MQTIEPTSPTAESNDTPFADAVDVGPGDEHGLPDPHTPLDVGPFESLVATVLRVADAHRDAPAVVLSGSAWSYADLRIAMLGAASELAAFGIEPGGAVAVTGARSHGLIASVLGIMARNAILVPIDPLLPPRRRREMLERSGARFLVEVGRPDGDPIDLAGLEIRRFSMPAEPPLADAVRRAAEGYEIPDIDGDDAAYLLFTSGTTGEPKGIVGRQRGLSHFLSWERAATGIGPGDRTAQLTGLSFDVVLRDLFLPLTSGAALHLPPLVPGTTSPAEILEFLARDRVTLMHAVPTIAAFWMTDIPDGLALPDLRWVLFAGEPLPGALVQAWRDRFGTLRIGNLYGPTETTLAKCFLEVAAPPEPGVQPVGRAIPGAQALVMDGDRLCGPGELGEIVIRTPYRSLGYLGAVGDPTPPFIRNPFTDDPDDLVYRTGDRGRYRPDGILEIHGRLDEQVKILGVRIEPSEVSARLAEHPAVRSCTVVARPDDAGQTALVAYLVAEGAAPPDPGDLRSFLEERVIRAMVPRAFVVLPELPRTPNGKVDRRALPDPDWATSGSGGPRTADERGPAAAATSATAATRLPAGPQEEQATEVTGRIQAIFADLLGRDVGPDDDFFRLGGHSLMAAKLVQRIEAGSGVRVQVRSLFRHPTPRGLATIVVGGGEGSRLAGGATHGHRGRPSGASSDGAPLDAGAMVATGGSDSEPLAGLAVGLSALPDSIVPVAARGTAPPLFVLPGVGSRILFLRHLARHLDPDRPLYALHSRFLESGDVYERIEDLADRYVRDLRRAGRGPWRLLGFSYGGLLALEVARRLAFAGEEVVFLGVVDTRLPDLRQHGPWSIPRSIPRRLLNLAALLQPLSGADRRTYLRTRLLVARQNTVARSLGWLQAHLPRPLHPVLPQHPFGPEETDWLAADRAASRRYHPRPFPGPIHYFWAAHSQRPPSVYDHREGWAQLADGGLDVRPVPGNHLTVLLEPLVRTAARSIRESLALAELAAGRRDGATGGSATGKPWRPPGDTPP